MSLGDVSDRKRAAREMLATTQPHYPQPPTTMASPLPPPYDVGKHAAFVQPCRGARPLKTLKKVLVATLAVVGALHLSNVVTWRGPASAFERPFACSTSTLRTNVLLLVF